MIFSKAINALKSNWSKKAVVLCYHRIAEPKADPWGMAVNQEHFSEQIALLKQAYNVVAVPDMVQQVETKQLVRRSVCITFDDGYIDNYLVAKPVLEKHRVPATVFVPSKFLGSGKPFWWDELEAIFLHSPKLPAQLTVEIAGQKHDLDNGEGISLSPEQQAKHKTWNGKDDPPTCRAKLYVEMWRLLRPLLYSDINAVMDKLKEWSGFDASLVSKDSVPMTKAHLAELAGSSLFTIGMHTHSHPSLAHHSYNSQKEEILSNRTCLEKELNTKVEFIAFPYGSYNQDTLKAVKELNLKGAFTTKRRTVSAGSSTLELGRFYVGDWSAAKLEDNLSRWFQK